MILQDLIRNIIFYKGFINPLLQMVIDHALRLNKPSTAGYSLSSLLNTSGYMANKPQQMKIDASQSLIAVTGTHTIPDEYIFFVDADVRERTIYSATDSSMISTLLADECVGIPVKTSLQTANLAINAPQSYFISSGSLTTGLFIENNLFVLSRETHEKREYLGEFSLSHEGR